MGKKISKWEREREVVDGFKAAARKQKKKVDKIETEKKLKLKNKIK